MSGMTGAEARAYHMEQADIENMMDWFEHKKLPRNKSAEVFAYRPSAAVGLGLKKNKPMTNPVASPPI